MAIEHRMDGAFGGNPDVAIEPPDQQFADLARAPVRLLGLQAHNQGLELLRELVGIAHRPPRAVAQRLKPVVLVAVENLVAGLAGYTELPADLRQGLPIQKPGDKAQALFHYRTRFPRHPHLPQNKSGKCNPCVRYVLSPMSRAAHTYPNNISSLHARARAYERRTGRTGVARGDLHIKRDQTAPPRADSTEPADPVVPGCAEGVRAGSAQRSIAQAAAKHHARNHASCSTARRRRHRASDTTCG